MHFDERKIKLYSNFLDQEFLKEFLLKTKNAPIQPATVGKIINGKYTAVYDKWCTAEFVNYENFTEDLNYIVEKIKECVENNYNISCYNAEINFLHYKEGASYSSHIDGQLLEEDNVKRVTERDITCVFYLNEDYNGGEIYFNFFNKIHKPNANDLLIYPTTWEYMHGVNTVHGSRYAIVIWFTTTPHLNVDSKIKNKTILNQLVNYLKQT